MEEQFQTNVFSENESSSDEEQNGNENESFETSEPELSNVNWDVGITVKYLDGKITFDELTDAMEQTDDHEKNEESPRAAFEREFTSSQYRGKKSRKGGEKRPRRRLPMDLVGLMGEANVSFARGDHDDAVKMYMEVIRLAPNAPEPFQQLGVFYEEKGDIQKAFQFYLIASYLCPSDGESWVKVAEMATELGHYKQAIICYSKAIKIFPDNINLHFQRCQLYETIGDMKKAIEGYDYLIRNLEPSDGELALKLAKDIVKLHYNNGDVNAGIVVMEAVLKKYNSFVSSEEVNVYLELLLLEKKYLEALISFQKYCGVKFFKNNQEYEISYTNQEISFLTVKLLYGLPIDLRAKLIITLINVKSLESIDELLEVILLENPEEIGDLYLDIVDELIAHQMYAKAITLLVKLIDTVKYNIAEIWLRYAKCLNQINDSEASIIAYSTVIRLSPTNFNARLELAKLLIANGKEIDAMEISSFFKNEKIIHIKLLLLHCQLLFNNKKWNEFANLAPILLLSEMTYLKHPKEISVMITSTLFRTRMESLKDIHKEVEIAEENLLYDYIKTEISKDELFQIFVKLCHVLYKLNENNELIRIVFSAYTCQLLNEPTENVETLDYYALICCYLSQNSTYTYPLIKALLVRYLSNNQVWNLFCPIMMRLYQDLRHNRFCIRLFIKNPEHLALAYFNGHNAMMSGSYKHALAEYVGILKQHSEDSFAAFSIVLAFVHLACQKFTSNRHSIVVQLCAFLDLYLELRGECQESLYNVGRTFHQLGLVHNAVHFYKKALQCNQSIIGDTNNLYDLRRETAYNLSLIYKNSGANDLALQLLKRHFTV